MRTALLLSAALLSADAALAGRPLVTEDAGTVALGACELESYLARASVSGEPSERLLSLQLGCGVRDDTQLALQHQRSRAGDHRQRGLSVGGKTRLVDGGDDAPSVALAYGLGASAETGRDGMSIDGQYLNGVVSWPLSGGLTLHGNLGWNRSRLAHQTSTAWALALEHADGGPLDLMGELFDDDRTHHPWVQAGLRWNVLSERLWLDASWGWQTGTRARAATVGLRLAF